MDNIIYIIHHPCTLCDLVAPSPLPHALSFPPLRVAVAINLFIRAITARPLLPLQDARIIVTKFSG
jgi:hypothetical protein